MQIGIPGVATLLHLSKRHELGVLPDSTSPARKQIHPGRCMLNPGESMISQPLRMFYAKEWRGLMGERLGVCPWRRGRLLA